MCAVGGRAAAAGSPRSPLSPWLIALLSKKKKFGVASERMKCTSGATLPSNVRRAASRGRLPRNCVEAEMALVLRLPLIVGNGPPGATSSP